MILRSISAALLLAGAVLSSGCCCCWEPCGGCGGCGGCGCHPCCSPCCSYASPISGTLVSDHARLVPTPASSGTWQAPMPTRQ